VISCLSLVQHSHVAAAAGAQGSRSVTACGLAIEAEHVTPGMFAADAASATCPQCRAEPARAREALPADDLPGLARWLIETAIGTKDCGGLEQIVAPSLSARLNAARIDRLHALFPRLEARIDEIVAQQDTAMVCYTIACDDPSGLIGAAGERLKLHQAVVIGRVGGLLARIDPLIDDFAFWTLPRPDGPVA